MADAKTRILSLTVADGADGALRVGIEIGDNDDTATAQNWISARVVLPEPLHPNTSVDEAKLAALRSIRALIDRHIDALDESTRKARGWGN